MTFASGLGDIGIVERFAPGERERVEAAVRGLKRLGCRRLRTRVSRADYATPAGAAWNDWLLPRLAREFELLLRVDVGPDDPGGQSGFLDRLVEDHGDCFEWLELWHEPQGGDGWDWRIGADRRRLCETIGAAASRLKRQGKRPVLGGLGPGDGRWLALMSERGVLRWCDAVALHRFPNTRRHHWKGWPAELAELRRVLHERGEAAELWIVAAGHATWRHDDKGHLSAFLEFAEAPAERRYWCAWQDSRPGAEEPRLDHLGLVRTDGAPKLLHRALSEGGIAGVRRLLRLHRPARRQERPVVITGGAGFLGTNLADALARDGQSVLIYDSLERPGVETNLEWLSARHGRRVSSVLADIRDPLMLADAVERARAVFHFAAQVAVTTSVADPARDLDVNLRGTFAVLEACRRRSDPPPLLFASTNKVYGRIDDLPLVEAGDRYVPADPELARHGIAENRPLEFCSPYGCSKGAADQYVLDHARIYGLPATVLRMSCLYGPHQFGTEDQGWVAHFLISALAGAPVTIYGDGRQVRDILWIGDAVAAWRAALAHIGRLSGRACNLGGGPANAVSLRDLLGLMAAANVRPPPVRFDDWRPGDQRWYVSDSRAFAAVTGWRPAIAPAAGVARLSRWLAVNWNLLSQSREIAEHEGGLDQSELDLRRQHLLRLPRSASAAGVRLRRGAAGPAGAPGSDLRRTP